MTLPVRARRSRHRRVCVGLLLCLAATAPAGAGHELPFYPGYYPQEIKIDTLSPAQAAPLLKTATLHAYLGPDPFAGGRLPADVSAVESLAGYVVLTFNSGAAVAASAERRCEAARRIARALVPGGGFTPHPYPVTPFHEDYLHHFDLVQSARKLYAPAGPRGGLRVLARGALAQRLAGQELKVDKEWDATLEEIEVTRLTGARGAPLWIGAPWQKEGWYHAYLVQAPAEAPARRPAESLYRRLASGAYADLAERTELERNLVKTLTAGCERVVLGYTIRREPFATEFSQGIENVAWDSQAGMGSAIFVRTAKLKDFPWNGWLRVGVPAPAAAAWNPIAGFSDPTGRLVWAAVGDPALLPVPHGGSWVANRATVSAVTGGGRIDIPEDALLPEPGTGMPREIGPGKRAHAQIVYRLAASAFHDNTRMTVADAVYPYLLAARWGATPPGATAHDAAVAAATTEAREWLAGFRAVRVDSEVRKYSDVTFTYVVPVIEVYLQREAADSRELAAVAPPWSPVPWHVIALLEETVKRGGFAFSAAEASRRGVRWLDVVRDPRAREAMTTLLDGFAAQAWVPPALKRFVTADEAQNRWASLRQFVRVRGHGLVTNGPYQLEKATDSSVTLAVFRDLSNPVGVGSFDRFAIPRRAYPVRVAFRGHRLEVTVEVERAEKFLRSHRLVREPMAAPASGGDRTDVAACRYVVLDAAGAVAAAGLSQDAHGARLLVDLKGKLRPGPYTALVALSLGDNHTAAEVSALDFRVEAVP